MVYDFIEDLNLQILNKCLQNYKELHLFLSLFTLRKKVVTLTWPLSENKKVKFN